MVQRRDVLKHKAECRFFPCKYFLESDGCRVTTRLADMKAHEDACPFGVYPCINLIANVRRKLGVWTTCNDNNALRWSLCEQGLAYHPSPLQYGFPPAPAGGPEAMARHETAGNGSTSV
eukprot:jgi/Mesvir1/18590/Mv17099-RA.1